MDCHFVVATKMSILHRMDKRVPEANLVAASGRAVCRYMNRITLPQVLRSRQDGVHRVTVPDYVADRARRALARMVSLG